MLTCIVRIGDYIRRQANKSPWTRNPSQSANHNVVVTYGNRHRHIYQRRSQLGLPIIRAHYDGQYLTKKEYGVGINK